MKADGKVRFHYQGKDIYHFSECRPEVETPSSRLLRPPTLCTLPVPLWLRLRLSSFLLRFLPS